jgi:hypothetical protein
VNCVCHGEAAYWQKDKRLRAGGHWSCAVKKRAYERDRYDADPIHRIGKNLHDHARRRGDTLKRQREALAHG